MTRLPAMEVGIAAIGGDQIAVASRFCDPAAFHGDDAISGSDGRKAVRDNDYRPPLGNLAKIGLNDFFAFGIERRCCFIEDQDARIADGFGDGPTPLPFAGVCAAAVRRLSRRFAADPCDLCLLH
jgi:hypothetical protein